MNDNNSLESLFKEDKAREKPFLEISDNKMEAYVVIPDNPANADVFAMLTDAEVTYGLDTDVIDKVNQGLHDGMKLEKRYLVASGKQPVRGQDGEMILRTRKPEDIILSSQDLSRVDYKTYKRKLLAICEQEKPIAMIIDPTQGKNGMDVMGNSIQGEDGKEVVFKLGKNVYQQGRKLVSTIDGLIEYKKNRDDSIDVDVTDVYIVKEDVDFSTGNIEFPGAVIVKGIVKAGFEIRATKDVVADTIRGNVYTEGSVMAKQGILGGTEKAHIEAKGPVFAKFVQNARIISGDSISIKKSIVSSELYSEATIDVEGSPGAVIGGSISAVEGIEAKFIGSESYVKTEVALYASAKEIYNLRKIAPKRFALSKLLGQLDAFLGGEKIDLGALTADAKTAAEKVMKKREQARQELLMVNNEIRSIQKKLAEPVSAVITVGKTVYPEVRVSISGKFKVVKEERNKGSFRYDKEFDTLEFK